MLLLIDPSAKLAYGSLFSQAQVQVPDWTHGETRPITVGLVSKISSPVGARVFEPMDITGATIRAALGKGFLSPVAGSFTLTYGANTTTALNYNATAQEMEDALNLLASVIAAGLLDVTGSSGFFVITFRTVGARTAISGDATNLAPLSILDLGTLIDGSASLKEVQSLRILQNVGAYTSLTLASEPAAAGVSLVQTGGAGLNAKVRVSLITRQSGLLITGAQYTIVSFVTSDDFTNVGALSNATGVTFIATGTTPTTWTHGSALRRTDAVQPYDGSFTLLVAGVESALLASNASASDVVAALEGIQLTSGVVVTGRKYKIVTFATSDDFTNIGGTNVTGNVFVASGTTPTTWTHGSVLSPVAAGNVAVVREAEGQYLIAFQGDMANTAMGTMTADGSALRFIQTLSGNLNCATAAIDLMLAGADSISIAFEVEQTPAGGAIQKLLRVAGNLLDSIIDPSDTAPVRTQVNISSGTGTPEAAVLGNVGDLFLRTDGSTSTTLYVKTSGAATNTGWTAK